MPKYKQPPMKEPSISADKFATFEPGIPAVLDRFAVKLHKARERVHPLIDIVEELDRSCTAAIESHSMRMKSLYFSADMNDSWGEPLTFEARHVAVLERLGTPSAKEILVWFLAREKRRSQGIKVDEGRADDGPKFETLMDVDFQLLKDEGSGLCPLHMRDEMLDKLTRIRALTAASDALENKLRETMLRLVPINKLHASIEELAGLLGDKKKLQKSIDSGKTRPMEAKKASRKLEKADRRISEILESLGNVSDSPDAFWEFAGDEMTATVDLIWNEMDAVESEGLRRMDEIQDLLPKGHDKAHVEAYRSAIEGKISSSLEAPPQIRFQVYKALEKLGEIFGVEDAFVARLIDELEIKFLTEEGPDAFIYSGPPDERRVMLLNHAFRNGKEEISIEAVYEEGSHALRSLFHMDPHPFVLELFGSLGLLLATGKRVVPFDYEKCAIIERLFLSKDAMTAIPDEIAEYLKDMLPFDMRTREEHGTEAGNIQIVAGFIDHAYTHMIPALAVQSMADTGYLETFMDGNKLISLPTKDVALLAAKYGDRCRSDPEWKERFKDFKTVCGYLLKPDWR